MRQLLTEAPVLGYPTRDDPFLLDTDASNTGLGGVLSQIQDGEERVIAYGSKTLSSTQTRYCTTHLELLAVVTFVKHYKHYLWGRHFTVRTDHASLRWLINFRDPEGMVARWLTILETYDFVVEHRKGSLHGNADGLSRKVTRPCKRETCPDCGDPGAILTSTMVKTDILSPITPLPGISQENRGQSTASHAVDRDPFAGWLQRWTRQELHDLQGKDLDIKVIIDLKAKHETKPRVCAIEGESEGVRVFWQAWDDLQELEGIWYKLVREDQDTPAYRQLLAPRQIRQEIMWHLHNTRVAGHLGQARTYASVRRRFFWPKMKGEVRRWCQQCLNCAKVKKGTGLEKAPLQQMAVGETLERVASDILGPLPCTEIGRAHV